MLDLKHLNETNPASLAIGGSALAALVLGKIFLKNRPVAIFVVVGGIVASTLLGLDAKGVKLLGEVPQGLPALGIPDVYWSDLNALLPLALLMLRMQWRAQPEMDVLILRGRLENAGSPR